MQFYINLTKKAGKLETYGDSMGCPIAKALFRKGIVPLVFKTSWAGLFLGIIPIWGNVSSELDKAARDVSKEPIESTCFYARKIGLLNIPTPALIPILVLELAVITIICSVIQLICHHL